MNEARRANLLADQPFFSDFPRRLLRPLAARSYQAQYSAGEMVFAEGQIADRFFLIRRGVVRLDMQVLGVGRVDVEDLGCDMALGWSWLIQPFEWHLSATAINRTNLIVFDASVLRDLMDADPELGYRITRRVAAVLANRLQHTRRRVISADYERDMPARSND